MNGLGEIIRANQQVLNRDGIGYNGEGSPWLVRKFGTAPAHGVEVVVVATGQVLRQYLFSSGRPYYKARRHVARLILGAA